MAPFWWKGPSERGTRSLCWTREGLESGSLTLHILDVNDALDSIQRVVREPSRRTSHGTEEFYNAIRRDGESSMNILTVNLLFNTLVFWIAARIYVFPKLPELKPKTVLLPILLLHASRHLGLMFLAPGATYPGIPTQFTYPAAYGDLLAALLALAAIPALVNNSPTSRLLVWIFNVEGTVDLIGAITLATIYDASPSMGPAYWIPAFWVPALLVTHYITFVVLLKYWPRS